MLVLSQCILKFLIISGYIILLIATEYVPEIFSIFLKKPNSILLPKFDAN